MSILNKLMGTVQGAAGGGRSTGRPATGRRGMSTGRTAGGTTGRGRASTSASGGLGRLLGSLTKRR